MGSPRSRMTARWPAIALATYSKSMVVHSEAEESRIAPERRKAVVERAWALRDKAVAEGLETWDLDRVNAELARERE